MDSVRPRSLAANSDTNDKHQQGYFDADPFTSACWQSAAQRAVAEQIQVRQLAGSGQWLATSGSDHRMAYELDATGAIAHGCNCLAGRNGDPICKHRASRYLSIGAFSLTTPEVSRTCKSFACTVCGGPGSVSGTGRPRCQCSVCGGRGRLPREKTAAQSREGKGGAQLVSHVPPGGKGGSRAVMDQRGGRRTARPRQPSRLMDHAPGMTVR